MQDEYNLYWRDKFIGTYEIAAAAEQLDTTEEQVKEVADTTHEYKEWRIVKLYKKKPDSATVKVMKEWDKLTEPYRTNIINAPKLGTKNIDNSPD